MPNHKPANLSSAQNSRATQDASATRALAIFPSLISADQLNLETVIAQLDPHCAGYHLDIMDGQFVPNLSWGPAFINTIAHHTTRIIWVHLMTQNPSVFLDQLELPEASIVSVHLEAISPESTPALIQKIKNKKWRPSLAIKPSTPVSALAPYLELLDHVLIMSVEPGFSGQEFLPSTEQKIDQLRALIQQQQSPAISSHTPTHSGTSLDTSFNSTTTHPITLALDGGINSKNIAHLANKGATQFAVAQGIFGQPDPVKALEQLQKLVKQK
jgi:ribulose-phosphate 3-epimerase